MLSKDFHCALIEIMRFWHNRGTSVALEEEVFDAIVRKEGGKCEAASPPTDNDDWDIYHVRHGTGNACVGNGEAARCWNDLVCDMRSRRVHVTSRAKALVTLALANHLRLGDLC